MERRGKPKTTYVPIAVRDLSMNFFKKDNFAPNFDKNTFLNNNLNNMRGNPRNMYPINTKINNSLTSPQIHGSMYNNSNFYNGYLENFNNGLKLDPLLYSKSLAMQNDALSTNKLIKFNSQHATPNTLYNLPYANNFKYYNGKDQNMDSMNKFDPFSPNLENCTAYETLLLNSSLSPAPTTIPKMYNQHFNCNGLYNTNNIGKTVNNKLPVLSSNKTSLKTNGKKTSDKDKKTPPILSSREEIKNNYLLTNGSPFSECSIDSDVVVKQEPIYNINEYGILVDTNPDVISGLKNPCSIDINMDNIDASIIERTPDFNYMNEEDFLGSCYDGSCGKTSFNFLFFGEEHDRDSSALEDKDLIFENINSTSSSNAQSIKVLGTE
uniref:Uncharacterized protein n=2 Tax=Theileria parva TaxID=5875 RepID=Q4MYW2_THEPA|eukprot:XP_762853.1 hypothetical protein [Theileria parva strain Muguga]